MLPASLMLLLRLTSFQQHAYNMSFHLHCRLLYGDQAAYFEMEVKPRIKHAKFGQVSMVNNGSNMHGSQVMLKDKWGKLTVVHNMSSFTALYKFLFAWLDYCDHISIMQVDQDRFNDCNEK